MSDRKALPAALLAVLAFAGPVAGCGGDSGGGDSTSAVSDQAAPPPSDFPPASGKSLDQLLSSSGAQPTNDIVVAPASKVFEQGRDRFGFGVFTPSQKPITGAQLALYAAPSSGGPAVGPYPARIDSLHVESQFESETTRTDPDAATDVYVSNVRFDQSGNWNVVAMIQDGDQLTASLLPSVAVGPYSRIPDIGERPPPIHTPTAPDVRGDLSKIDTRSPHDDMHKVDFADVLGRKPVVLLFATPALCQSRVCGPVVDVAEQVKAQYGNRVAFIHMEVYDHNNVNDGLRPQMKAFGLSTEPWVFVIDKNGTISTRIEGAFGLSELQNAVQKVAG